MSAPPAAAQTNEARLMPVLAPGDMVDGRYRVDAFLGGGGMASVYRATHLALQQTVAIKVISPLIRSVPGMAQRFMREARAATQLKSEHVARVTDVGAMPDGAPFMVMEFLEGTDLDALVESPIATSVEDCVDYVLQACEALAEVHGLGIVHRDLKPANLFLTKGADGLPSVKLIDFGISRFDSPLDTKEVIALTQPDAVMGSPRYMSPEQMEASSKVDSRSDIYGIGAVLYELLTKRVPHDGDTFMDIYASATLAAPDPPSKHRSSVPDDLDDVVLRCLAIDPADRYSDAAELAHALAPFGPEGSPGRADGISRILGAARSRGKSESPPADGTKRRPDSGSSSAVRRRGKSAHTLRRRRVLRVTIVGALVALAGVAFAGRSLYLRGEANGIASATATPVVAAIAPPARAPFLARAAGRERARRGRARARGPRHGHRHDHPDDDHHDHVRRRGPRAHDASDRHADAGSPCPRPRRQALRGPKIMKLRVLPLAVAMLLPRLAFADPPKAASDPAGAQTLFYEARQLMNAGKFAEACPKLEESLRLDDGLGTAFNLADCNEHIGKLATAWAGFLDVASGAKSVGQADREKLARKRAASLEPRLPKMIVDVPSTLKDATVKRDGVVVGAAAWGTPIPVDAGPHQITVTAPGKQWDATSTAAEKQTVHVAVPAELPAAAIAEAPPPPPPLDAANTTGGAGFVPPAQESRGGTQRALGWTLAGVGLVGIGVGAGFGLSSMSKRDDSRDHCQGNACDPDGVSLRSDAIKNGNIATISMIAGGAAVVGGLALVLTAPKGEKPRTGTIQAVPMAGLGSAGMLLQGTFQ